MFRQIVSIDIFNVRIKFWQSNFNKRRKLNPKNTRLQSESKKYEFLCFKKGDKKVMKFLECISGNPYSWTLDSLIRFFSRFSLVNSIYHVACRIYGNSCYANRCHGNLIDGSRSRNTFPIFQTRFHYNVDNFKTRLL